MWCSQPSVRLFPGVKQPGHAVDHPFLSSAEVKNGWSYNSTPPVCLLGVDRGDLTVS